MTYSSIERKLLLLFLLNLVIGSVAFIDSAAYNAEKAEFVQALTQYFICESRGHPVNSSNSCGHENLKQLQYIIFVILFDITIGLLPLGMFHIILLQYCLTFYLKGPLIYVINCKSLKRFLSKQYHLTSLAVVRSPGTAGSGESETKYAVKNRIIKLILIF